MTALSAPAACLAWSLTPSGSPRRARQNAPELTQVVARCPTIRPVSPAVPRATGPTPPSRPSSSPARRGSPSTGRTPPTGNGPGPRNASRDDHVLGDAIHGRRRAVPAGLPFAVAHLAVVEQAVAPHQHGQLPLADEVPVIVAHRAGEQLGRVLATAPCALLAGDQEDLVHADVEGVGPEGVDQLIHQVEDDPVDAGLQGAPLCSRCRGCPMGRRGSRRTPGAWPAGGTSPCPRTGGRGS